MTSLTKMSYERRQQKDVLTRYMKAKGISVQLRSDIGMWVSSKSRVTTTSRRIYQEADVASLRDLPFALITQLRAEVHLPALEVHCLFAYLSHKDPETIVRICNEAMTDGTLGAGEELFHFGAKCTRMYFVAGGTANYTIGLSGDQGVILVKPQRWLSEACLWVQWEHRGRLLSTAPFEYSSLEAGGFQKIMVASWYCDGARRYARHYMTTAEQQHCGAQGITDVWGQWMQ
eukprot:CAMPEP_0115762560 /NCGR_PEP_ID=MMETSP0272-20121206/101090_1 /TAXON_ID=71861 /ORGANISM="Scrippsiella trochoidea, Strain CCMP3099" /LENGTH=230 /DNA_ID=CAMNT_0003208285 /DNA_START=16 /DNA_END=705 /DNA_ORIENTATION=-